MATINIEERKLKKGVSYRARARITKYGKIVEEVQKTFENFKTAESWADNAAKKLDKKYEQIANGTYFDNSDEEELREITVGALIKEYLTDPVTSEKVGRTKEHVLEALYGYDISHKIVSQLKPRDLIAHCKTRLKDKTKPKPQTVYHDVTYLHSVIKLAKEYFEVNSNLRYHDDAIPVLVELGLIGRSKRRTKRPSENALIQMEAGLKEREKHRSAKIPFSDIFKFSIYTAMRVGEITELEWEDIDHEHKTIIVKSRKSPTNEEQEEEHNDWEIPLLSEAYPIILRQKERIDPENPHLIFPYNPRSISAGWQRVRNKLGIKDLRYHDLRREAASRLAEEGYEITTVAKITGHKNINILFNVYTTLEMKKLSKEKYEEYNNKKEKT
ncbi:site-specific integrase [Pseudoalteromonas sp. H105]|uniref:site-specific integrase n=1 Tax=Pseudoalteromonas sp. H105 TaxID=1348393 RepID=UPI0007323D5E|nr:site-specific integrase [Pseudoalteromonas sp. H105]KTF12214.1 integrase [Pseudoalteromonas sp. H105]